MIGDWRVTLHVDGERADTDSFTVEPHTGGLLWWGPFAGFAGLAFLLALATAAGYGPYRLVRRLIPL